MFISSYKTVKKHTWIFCVLIVVTALKTSTLINKKCKYSTPALAHFQLPYFHRKKYANFENLDILSLVIFIFFCEIIVWYYKALEILKKFSYCVFLSQILHAVREIHIEATWSKSVFYSGFVAFWDQTLALRILFSCEI